MILIEAMDELPLIVGAILAILTMLNFSLHKLEEGHVGVYYRVHIKSITLIHSLILFCSFSVGRSVAPASQQSRLSHDGSFDHFVQIGASKKYETKVD